MHAEAATTAWARRVYGAGVMALASVGLASGNFVSGQPVPAWMPGRTALAYAVAAFLLVAGAAVAWRRTVARGAAALAVYYSGIVVILLHGAVVLAHPSAFGAYSGGAMQVAIALGAVLLCARRRAARSPRLTRMAQVAFALCALLFGGAHFVYFDLTAPLVPEWLPPSQAFWAYATGIAHVAGGVAILVRFKARLAAILLAAMYAAFIPLVFAPVLLADAHDVFRWNETATTLALVGVALLVADSLARPRAVSGVASAIRAR